MKNSHYTLFALLLSLVLFNSTLQAQNYCDNGAYSADYFWIESVASDDFYHSAGPLQGILDDSDHLYQGYLDYTDQVINWQAGLNPLELTPGILIPNFPMHWQVWIDFNVDQVFTPDELVTSEQNFGTITQIIDLSSLVLTQDLVTRMRVSMSLFDPAPVCGGFGMGEVEDYQVIISPAVQNTHMVPEEYVSIQAAVDAALPNERILVNDGTYNEHIIIDKPLLVESVNGAELTKIIGQIGLMTFQVNSPDVTIKGFGLTGAYGWRYAGIYFSPGSHRGHAVDNSCFLIPGIQRNDVGVLIRESDDIVVEGFNCVAGGTGYAGIWVEDSNGSHFINNIINNQIWYGIHVFNGSNNLIENNTLSHNTQSGIHVNDSNQITIKQNVCSENIQPNFNNFHGNGIVIDSSTGIIVEANQCNENSNRGIMVFDSNDVQIIENELFDNNIGLFSGLTDGLMLDGNHFTGDTGVYMGSGLNTTVSNNIFDSATDDGLYLQSHHNGLFFNNYFINNDTSVNFSQSDNNLFFKNVIKPRNQIFSPCHIRFNSADGNRLYMNDFLFDHNAGLCSFFSNTYFLSANPIDYIYENELYQSYLGNYYQDDNQLDIDGDGVVDFDVIFNEGESIDEFSLSKEIINFEIVE
jgi:parallel beta-helix repeat protein